MVSERTSDPSTKHTRPFQTTQTRTYTHTCPSTTSTHLDGLAHGRHLGRPLRVRQVVHLVRVARHLRGRLRVRHCFVWGVWVMVVVSAKIGGGFGLGGPAGGCICTCVNSTDHLSRHPHETSLYIYISNPTNPGHALKICARLAARWE